MGLDALTTDEIEILNKAQMVYQELGKQADSLEEAYAILGVVQILLNMKQVMERGSNG